MFIQYPDGRVHHTNNTGSHLPAGAVKLTKAAGEKAVKEQARNDLRDILKPGQKVHTILRHVSASGMSRRISLVTVNKAGEVRNLDTLTALATGYTMGSQPGLLITGCGMDMGFELVYQLGKSLWPNGTPQPHGSRNGEPDSDGGYALKQEWI